MAALSGFRGQLLGLLAAALCIAAAVLPAAARADLQTLDFESGPALGTPVDGVGDVSFPRAEGFRPYRVDVGSRAHSGTVVGDIGRCAEENTEAGGCEFFNALTVGRLARTADRVTLFAGRFGPVDPISDPEFAVLTILRADGSEIAHTAPIAVDDSGFDAELSLASAAGDIAAFRVEAFKLGPTGKGAGGDLGIDDVKVSFASGAKPDFAVATSNEVVPLVQGQSAEVPVTLSRVNGSSGPVQFTVTNLPKGVSAKVSPNPLPGGQTAATITLTAAPDAPDTAFLPVDATVTADPLGDADVGPAPRSATLSVRVATSFGLRSGEVTDANQKGGSWIQIPAPDCTAFDVPLEITRDIGLKQDISLSLVTENQEAPGLPPGITASILPDPVVSPGGGLIAHRTLRFQAEAGADLNRLSQLIDVEARIGSGPGAIVKRLAFEMTRQRPEAHVATSTPGSGLASTPRFGRDGTHVQIHGSGFCPGTTVEVGNSRAQADARVVDPHTIEFTTPRTATSGRILIIPPGSLLRYPTEDSLTVDSVRNRDAFQFHNMAFHHLSLDEFTEAFGADEIFIKANPCWPLGDCGISTGIVSPTAALKWGILELGMRQVGGHCFGISLAIERMKAGKVSYARFSADGGGRAHNAFELSGGGGPSPGLESFLDAMHTRQATSEFLREYFRRPKSLQPQLDEIDRQFSHFRMPIISMRDGTFSGHAVLVYDLEQTPTSADIYVYDNNRPFSKDEESKDGELHENRLRTGVIHVDKVAKTWTYPEEASRDAEGEVGLSKNGGNDGSLWVIPAAATPENPHLPGFAALDEGLSYVLMGGSAAARPAVSSPGAESLPGLADSAAGRGFGLTLIKKASSGPFRVGLTGRGSGTYSQAYVAPGFLASVGGVETEKGVRDTLRGEGDSLSFDSGMARPLAIKLARQSAPGEALAATLQTHASAGGSDSAGFTDGGDLTYAHEGAATTVRFTVTDVRTNGGPSTFQSGPVRVHSGDRLRLSAVGRALGRMRLTVRGADGRRRTRTLRNHGHSHRRLSIRAPRVSRHRLVVPFKLSGFHSRAIVGAVLRLMHGGHLVAQKAVAIRVKSGKGRVTWRLPQAAKRGGYRLLADFHALSTGARGATGSASVSSSRRFRVQIRR